MNQYKFGSAFSISRVELLLEEARPIISGNFEHTFFEATIYSWVAMKLILEHIAESEIPSDVVFDETIFHYDNLYCAVKHQQYDGVGGFETPGFECSTALSALEQLGYIVKINTGKNDGRQNT